MLFRFFSLNNAIDELPGVNRSARFHRIDESLISATQTFPHVRSVD